MLSVAERWSKVEIVSVVLFLDSIGKSPAEIHYLILQVCGGNAISAKEICNILEANECCKVVPASNGEPGDHLFDVPTQADDIEILELLELCNIGSICNDSMQTSKLKKLSGINKINGSDERVIVDGKWNLVKPSMREEVIKSKLSSDVEVHSSGLKESSDLSNLKERKDEILYKNVHQILHKLSAQNYCVSASEIRQLDIATEESLNGVIDLVFEKAIDKPNCSIPYANMCKLLSLLKVPCSDGEGSFVDIRRCLFNKCQEEFDNHLANEQNREEHKRLIEECETDAEQKQHQEVLVEKQQENKRRHLGNIRFICWLFKLNVFTTSTMHQFLEKLLLQNEEVTVESVYLLLATIRNELESAEQIDSVMEAVPDAIRNRLQQPEQHLTPVASTREASLDYSVTDSVQDLELPEPESEKVQQSDTSVIGDELDDSPILLGEETVAKDIRDLCAEDTPENHITLKYTFKEDQWNPLKHDERKQYDREFLLSLQSHPLSMKKPSNLPNLEKIKDKGYPEFIGRRSPYCRGNKTHGKFNSRTPTNQSVKDDRAEIQQKFNKRSTAAVTFPHF